MNEQQFYKILYAKYPIGSSELNQKKRHKEMIAYYTSHYNQYYTDCLNSMIAND